MATRTFRAWLDYLAIPVPRHVRQMGYVRELRALRARHDRCRSDWHSHLEHTRAVILDAAAQCEQRRSALVVGSGLLFDIPLDELARQFGSVVLVDIVHAWSVHRRAVRLSNVRLLPLDVTGVVERCHALARRRAPARLPQRTVDCLVGEDFDLVASVNVLSQLPVVPNGYMTRRIRTLTEARDEGVLSRAGDESPGLGVLVPGNRLPGHGPRTPVLRRLRTGQPRGVVVGRRAARGWAGLAVGPGAATGDVLPPRCPASCRRLRELSQAGMAGCPRTGPRRRPMRLPSHQGAIEGMRFSA